MLPLFFICLLTGVIFECVPKGKMVWGSYSLTNNEVTAWQCNSTNFSNQKTLANREPNGDGKGKTKEQVRKLLAKMMRA